MSTEASQKRPEIGDEFAFKRGYSEGHEIYKVDGITPSGRIKCGPYTLNPDLSIRGERGYRGPFRAEPVTDAIREAVKRRRAISFIREHPIHQLSTERLMAIVDILYSASLEDAERDTESDGN